MIQAAAQRWCGLTSTQEKSTGTFKQRKEAILPKLITAHYRPGISTLVSYWSLNINSLCLTWKDFADLLSTVTESIISKLDLVRRNVPHELQQAKKCTAHCVMVRLKFSACRTFDGMSNNYIQLHWKDFFQQNSTEAELEETESMILVCDIIAAISAGIKTGEAEYSQLALAPSSNGKILSQMAFVLQFLALGLHHIQFTCKKPLVCNHPTHQQMAVFCLWLRGERGRRSRADRSTGRGFCNDGSNLGRRLLGCKWAAGAGRRQRPGGAELSPLRIKD